MPCHATPYHFLSVHFLFRPTHALGIAPDQALFMFWIYALGILLVLLVVYSLLLIAIGHETEGASVKLTFSPLLSLVLSCYITLVAGLLALVNNGTDRAPDLHTNKPHVLYVVVEASSWITLLAGFIIDRLGTHVCAALAALIIAVGVFLLHLSEEGLVEADAVLIPIAACLGQGLRICLLLALSVSLYNFPDHPGRVMSLYGGMLGLGTLAHGRVLKEAFDDDLALYCTYLGALNAFLCLVMGYFSQRIDELHWRWLLSVGSFADRCGRSMRWIFWGVFCGVAWLVAADGFELFTGARLRGHTVLWAIAGVVASLMAAPLYAGNVWRRGKADARMAENSSLVVARGERVRPRAPRAKADVKRGGLRLSQALCTAAFWLLLGAHFCGIAGPTVYLANLRPLTVALADLQPMSELADDWGLEFSRLLFLFYAANAALRVTAGALLDARPRLACRALCACALLGALLLVRLGSGLPSPPRVRWAMAALFGACYGLQGTVVPVMCAELYGLAHWAAVYGALNTGAALSAVGLAVIGGECAGDFLEHHGASEWVIDPRSGHRYCVGWSCYGPLLMALAVLSGFGCLLAFALLNTYTPYRRTLSFEERVQGIMEGDEYERHMPTPASMEAYSLVPCNPPAASAQAAPSDSSEDEWDRHVT